MADKFIIKSPEAFVNKKPCGSDVSYPMEVEGHFLGSGFSAPTFAMVIINYVPYNIDVQKKVNGQKIVEHKVSKSMLFI